MQPTTFQRSRVYHVIHCCAFFSLLILFQYACIFFFYVPKDPSASISILHRLIYFARVATIIGFLPWSLMTTLGLLVFNAFETEVPCNIKLSTAPFLCFRVVTKGLFPELVRKNVTKLKKMCLNMGLKNFIIQVAANKSVDLQEDCFVKQTVIPEDYQTSTKALYKARSLQYCLENNDVQLKDNDWIVHMDEETVATENSIRGILNFVADGKYQFGQGMLLLIHGKISNWVTSLMECWRVADDMGKLRFQMSVFHRLIVEWKGSFFVSKVCAEKAVSFDHGVEGSIAEDGYFGLLASQRGYKFQFIKGDMRDESTSSLWDMLQQRKRWIQGGYEIVKSRDIHMKTKWIFWIHMVGITCTSGGLVPLILNLLFPSPAPNEILDAMMNYLMFLNFYVQFYGMFMSYLLYPDRGFAAFCLCVVGSWALSPLNLIIGVIAVPMAFFGQKRGFYIVQKHC